MTRLTKETREGGVDSFDQFTRWCCAKCGGDGIDSWNKAVWDGPGFQTEEEIPNPWTVGQECFHCWHPVVVMFTGKDTPPRAIYSPVSPNAEGSFEDVLSAYAYEEEAFDLIERDLSASIELKPATTRDADWSRGCLAARGQLQ